MKQTQIMLRALRVRYVHVLVAMLYRAVKSLVLNSNAIVAKASEIALYRVNLMS